MNVGRRSGSANTTRPPARPGASTASARGVAGNPPSPGSPKRSAADSSRREGNSVGSPMSRVSSVGDCKKDDFEDERRGEDDRGLFHLIEQLAALEGALYSILDGLKSNATHVSYFCREYWGTSASHAQLSLEKLACNDRLKRQVQQACVLESLSLGVASHLCSGIMQNVSVTVRSRLRNLLYYIHENCLVLMDMVCQRWLAENPNHYDAELREKGHCPENLNLDILIRVKRYRRLRKGEHIMALRQHNEMISNVVRQLCRGAASKRPTLNSRGMSSPGDRSPGVRGPGSGAQLLATVNDIVSARMPLDRLRASTIRSKMLQFLRFKPLLNVDGSDPDCPWPTQDPYERYGAEHFAMEGPVIWFEPLPPMLPDLEFNPKLPPPPRNDTYTLVLDLDETLVHYFEFEGAGNYDIRPGMLEFLTRMSNLGYELVIFTAATQDYADWVIDQIDEHNLIQHRLYRQHALPWGPIFVKDLSRLGRDLERTMIIDNVQENFMLQPHNGLFICTWYDDPQDTALFGLTPLLEELINTRSTVPSILDKYRDQIPSWAGFDRYAQLEYNDFDPIGCAEDDTMPARGMGVGPHQAAPPVPAGGMRVGPLQAAPPVPGSPQQRANSGSTANTPVTYVNSYGQAMQAPAGVESAGGFRSEAPSATMEASPPNSPPVGGLSYTSPAVQNYQTQSQHSYTGPEQPTMSLTPMIVGTGPAVSSSTVGTASYDPYPYLQSPQPTPQGFGSQGGYPQQLSQAQARPPSMRQAQQIPGQVGPQRALVPTQQAGIPSAALSQAGPQRALAPQAQRQMVGDAGQAQFQMRPAIAGFSSVGGAYQTALPQAAHAPLQAPFFGQPGMGPYQAPAMRLR